MSGPTGARVFDRPADVLAAVGTDLGRSEWLTIDQERVDAFAAATGDHQWIHTDAERAATGPFGTTIAHGYLTLSLVPVLLRGLYRVEGARMSLNYGLGRVRFPTPVPVGGRIRAQATLASADQLDGAVQVVIGTVVEMEGSDKPACIVESIARYVD